MSVVSNRPKISLLVRWGDGLTSGRELWADGEPVSFGRLRWHLGGVCYRLDHWLSLPRLCRFGHATSVEKTYYNADACAVEEAWMECPRCGEWRGWSPNDSFGRTP